MSTEDVSAKARDLMAPVLGRDRTERLIALLTTLDTNGLML